MADSIGLKINEERLIAKLARLKSGEMNCELVKGDGRQEEAISRCELHLRGVRKAIAEEAPKKK